MSSEEMFSRSKQPLYLQLAAIFRRNIQSGNWKPGTQIPTLAELTPLSGVSRVTVRQAFNILEKEGLIRKGRGSGTFVNEQIPEIFKLSLPKTWQETIELSEKLDTLSISEIESEALLPEPLGIKCEFKRASSFRFMRRLHGIDNVPVCFSEVYVKRSLYRQHAAQFRAGTIAPVLEKVYGARLTAARQLMTIIEAGEDSAKWLQIPISTPVAELRRFACIDDEVVYFARLEFPTRFLQLEFDLLATPGKPGQATGSLSPSDGPTTIKASDAGARRRK